MGRPWRIASFAILAGEMMLFLKEGWRRRNSWLRHWLCCRLRRSIAALYSAHIRRPCLLLLAMGWKYGRLMIFARVILACGKAIRAMRSLRGVGRRPSTFLPGNAMLPLRLPVGRASLTCATVPVLRPRHWLRLILVRWLCLSHMLDL